MLTFIFFIIHNIVLQVYQEHKTEAPYATLMELLKKQNKTKQNQTNKTNSHSKLESDETYLYTIQVIYCIYKYICDFAYKLLWNYELVGNSRQLLSEVKAF